MDARPYTRSLDPADYQFLPHAHFLRLFVAEMTRAGVPHREWHEHRLWEYASIMQQLEDLQVPMDAEIVDVGSGASFFDPYCARQYPRLCCVDNMMYGDVLPMIQAQRAVYSVALPFYDLPCEDLSLFDDEQFDATICISTIEHALNHDAAFDELVRITKCNGLIMITSDYFRDAQQWETSPSRHLQVTPYTQTFVESLPTRWPVQFVGGTDLAYHGDFVHNYSFCNICLRKSC